MTKLGYLTDPLTLEFEARIVQSASLADGRVDVMLEETYFYPTGGGQPHDTGRLGESRVLDVFKDDQGNVIHRVEGEPAGPVVRARIDGERRLGHMQHHSAQHILSRSLEAVFQLETLSARISADSPSTVDLPEVELGCPELHRVERLANQIVFENRAIKSYFVSEDQIETVPFRRPPKVTGQIRVVEVDSFDYSACGGTHCPQTGMIGLIKLVKHERKNKKLRLHFAAGQQALIYLQQYQGIVTEICQQLSTGPDDVVALVRRQSAQLLAARREIKDLRGQVLALEAEKLAAQAEASGSRRQVLTELYPNRSMAELRALGKRLLAQDKLVAILAGYDGQTLNLVVSCADGSGQSAGKLLATLLAQIGGKGGGDARLAQGAGAATAEQVQQVMAGIQDHLSAMSL